MPKHVHLEVCSYVFEIRMVIIYGNNSHKEGMLVYGFYLLSMIDSYLILLVCIYFFLLLNNLISDIKDSDIAKQVSISL